VLPGEGTLKQLNISKLEDGTVYSLPRGGGHAEYVEGLLSTQEGCLNWLNNQPLPKQDDVLPQKIVLRETMTKSPKSTPISLYRHFWEANGCC